MLLCLYSFFNFFGRLFLDCHSGCPLGLWFAFSIPRALWLSENNQKPASQVGERFGKPFRLCWNAARGLVLLELVSFVRATSGLDDKSTQNHPKAPGSWAENARLGGGFRYSDVQPFASDG